MIYLAAPYTHDDDAVCDIRAQMVTYAAAVLTEIGLQVYSPLTHGHQLAKKRSLPKSFAYWQHQCRHHVGACDRVVVLTLDGWEDSIGVTTEIEVADDLDKQVTFIEFGDVL